MTAAVVALEQTWVSTLTISSASSSLWPECRLCSRHINPKLWNRHGYPHSQSHPHRRLFGLSADCEYIWPVGQERIEYFRVVLHKQQIHINIQDVMEIPQRRDCECFREQLLDIIIHITIFRVSWRWKIPSGEQTVSISENNC